MNGFRKLVETAVVSLQEATEGKPGAVLFTQTRSGNTWWNLHIMAPEIQARQVRDDAVNIAKRFGNVSRPGSSLIDYDIVQGGDGWAMGIVRFYGDNAAQQCLTSATRNISAAMMSEQEASAIIKGWKKVHALESY